MISCKTLPAISSNSLPEFDYFNTTNYKLANWMPYEHHFNYNPYFEYFNSLNVINCDNNNNKYFINSNNNNYIKNEYQTNSERKISVIMKIENEKIIEIAPEEITQKNLINDCSSSGSSSRSSSVTSSDAVEEYICKWKGCYR